MVDPEPQLAVLGFFGHQLSSWTPAVPLCPSMHLCVLTLGFLVVCASHTTPSWAPESAMLSAKVGA